eukprot:tig00000764_g3989.t1
MCLRGNPQIAEVELLFWATATQPPKRKNTQYYTKETIKGPRYIYWFNKIAEVELLFWVTATQPPKHNNTQYYTKETIKGPRYIYWFNKGCMRYGP